MKVAALDLGTNTFLCLIAEVQDNEVVSVYDDLVEVTRLGEGVHSQRCFSEGALIRAEQCFKKFSEQIQKHKVEKIVAVATSASRDVKNGNQLLEIAKKYNIPISIIPGEEEARLTYLGAISAEKDPKNKAVIDIGGGSTELISKTARGTVLGESFDIGSVRLTEMFIEQDPPTPESLRRLKLHIRAVMSEYEAPPGQTLIAVAGTPTTLACMVQEIDFEERKVEGFFLEKTVLKEWTERLALMSLQEKISIRGLHPKRADVIVAGSFILLEAMELFKVSGVKVSTRGLRFGVAEEIHSF